MMDKILESYKKLYDKYLQFEERKIPLCAAENFVSDFVKKGLTSCYEGKYCMSSIHGLEEYDFIGSSHIHKLLRLVSGECNRLFGATYSDVRTLSGMNCFNIVASALFNAGNKVLITTPNQGGHPSVPLILDRLSVEYDEIPYDYAKYQINYISLNDKLSRGRYDAVLFCQSDVLQPPDLTRISADKNTLILYDATQTLGMILSGNLPNPLKSMHSVVLIGGTHKTLPSVSCGLVMTNNREYVIELDKTICPTMLRTVQPNNIVSLLLALAEQEKFGKEYQNKSVDLANLLAKTLENKGTAVAKICSDLYSKTHQIFLLLGENKSKTLYKNAEKYGVTMNFKRKDLFKGYGIRLGVQEIARYNWGIAEINAVAELLILLSEETVSVKTDSIIQSIITDLSLKKLPHFVMTL